MSRKLSFLAAAFLTISAPVLSAETRIPLIFEPTLFGGQLFAPCEILGEKTKCLIDTGANISSVKETAANLALPTTGTSRYTSATGETVRCRNFILPNVRLGDVDNENLEVASCPDIDTRTRINIVGLDILGKTPLRIDYRSKILVLDPKVSPHDLQNFETDDFDHALLTIANGRGGKRQLESKAMFDTGAAVTVVDLKFARANPQFFDIISTTENGTDTHGNKIESVLMITTLFADKKTIAAEYVMGIDFTAIQKLTNENVKYILGHNILKNATWYIDFKTKQWSAE